MMIYRWVFAVMLCAALAFGCSKVTRENYDKIEMGIEYTDVVGFIGEPDNCDAAFGAKSCIWGNDAKNITVKFMGDKVALPSMTGL